jgi:hypothetical protein
MRAKSAALSTAIAAAFVALTGPDQQPIAINPKQIISIRERRAGAETHFHASIKCLLFTTDGKITGVTETCEKVKDLIEATGQELRK